MIFARQTGPDTEPTFRAIHRRRRPGPGARWLLSRCKPIYRQIFSMTIQAGLTNFACADNDILRGGPICHVFLYDEGHDHGVVYAARSRTLFYLLTSQ